MRALAVLAVVGVAWAQTPAPDLSRPQLNAQPPSIFEAIVGLIFEKNLVSPKLTPRRTTRIRITMDEAGAVVAHAVEKSSGDPGFDAAVINAIRSYQVTDKDRLPVPKDPKLRKQALGAGLIIPVSSPKEAKPVRKTVPYIPVPEAIRNPPTQSLPKEAK